MQPRHSCSRRRATVVAARPFVRLTGRAVAIRPDEHWVDKPLFDAKKATADIEGGYRVVVAGYTLVHSMDGLTRWLIDDSETMPPFAAPLRRLVIQGYTPS